MRRVSGQLTGSAGGSALALALLVCGCVFAALAGPALSLHTQTQALQTGLTRLQPTTKAVEVNTDWGAFTAALNDDQQAYLTRGQLASTKAALAQSFAGASLPVAGGAWAGLTAGPFPVTSGAAASAYSGAPPMIEALYRDPLTSNAQVVAGQYASTGVPAGTLGVAVTTQTAARFGLHPGSRLQLSMPSSPVTLAVTAILEIRDPASTFWSFDPTAGVPGLNTPPNKPSYWAGAVFADPGDVLAMQTLFSASDMNIYWEFPLATGRVSASQVHALDSTLNRLSTSTPALGDLSQAASTVTVSSPLIAELAAFLGTQAEIETVLILLFVSLIVTGAAVIGVAARMVAVRRADELTMLRARGGSLWQVAALMLRGTAAVSLPAALAGAGLAIAAEDRGASSALGWSLAALVMATALGGPPLVAVWRHRKPAPASNPARILTADLTGSRRVPVRRWVTEGTACAAALAALIVLHDQGLPAAGQADLFLAVTPVFVAIPVVLIVLRLYPLAVRSLLRLSARAAGATDFIALARAARNSLTGVLPVFALVLGLSVAAFAGMMKDAVTRGEVAASWQTTGADAVIQAGGQSGTGRSGGQVTPAVEKAFLAVPGVRRAAAVWETSWETPGEQQLSVLAVDPASYAALVATTPFRRFPAARIANAGPISATSTVSVLASPSAAAALGGGVSALASPAMGGSLHVRVAGQLSGTPAQPGNGAYVIMPMLRLPGAGGRPAPQILLLTGSGIDDARLSAVAAKMLPGAVITLRSAVLAALTGAPLQHGADLIMLLTVLAAAGLGLCTLVLGLALGSADRELTLARLTTMGHERAVRLVLTEAMPAVLAAAAAGLGCALALPRLVGSAVDLSVFTGTGTPVPLRPDWAALGLPAAAIVLIAAAVLAAETRTLRRRGVASMLRAN